MPPAERTILLTDMIQQDEKKQHIETATSDGDHAKSETSVVVGEMVKGEVVQDYGMSPPFLQCCLARSYSVLAQVPIALPLHSN